LDGQNSANGHHSQAQSFVSDRALGMPTALFGAHKFISFAEIMVVLQRLTGLRRLEDELPEIDRWASATINVSDLGPTTLTPRVTSLLNHPALQRLAGELQLGKLDTVFPTATHTRLQHSFGVYHDAREYIAALYYDPENPTFRTIFSPDDGKKCLVSALVHDLGQTSFGHDLEEVDLDIFSHEKITEKILASDFYKDRSGRTLKQIIEGPDYDGWNLSLSEVVDLIRGKGTRPVDSLLHDIINGQLDADKLDYLLRDSVECRVKYGHGIDSERFLRSLTTTARSEGRHALLRLAVEQKGAASAEAFAFARYQLYQSVYWHHTFRVVKAMLLDAATCTLGELKSKQSGSAGSSLLFNDFNDLILQAFLAHVIGFQENGTFEEAATANSEESDVKQDLWTEIQSRLAAPAFPTEAGKYSKDETLVFFWKLATGKAKTLFEDLINRNYYKRVFEISLSDLTDDQQLWIRDNLKGEKRITFRERVEEALIKTLRSQIQSQMESRESLVTDDLLQHMESITAQRTAFTIDLPLRGWTAKGDSPFFVSDYKRRHFRSSIGEVEGGHQENRLWSTYLPSMMKGKAFFRVYCEPSLHRVLTRVIGAIDVSEALREEIPQLNPQQ
jgi:HD superfamily phosphohydrolase